MCFCQRSFPISILDPGKVQRPGGLVFSPAGAAPFEISQVFGKSFGRDRRAAVRSCLLPWSVLLPHQIKRAVSPCHTNVPQTSFERFAVRVAGHFLRIVRLPVDESNRRDPTVQRHSSPAK